jgi:hypothetical protein
MADSCVATSIEMCVGRFPEAQFVSSVEALSL